MYALIGYKNSYKVYYSNKKNQLSHDGLLVDDRKVVGSNPNSDNGLGYIIVYLTILFFVVTS